MESGFLEDMVGFGRGFLGEEFGLGTGLVELFFAAGPLNYNNTDDSGGQSCGQSNHQGSGFERGGCDEEVQDCHEFRPPFGPKSDLKVYIKRCMDGLFDMSTWAGQVSFFAGIRGLY